MPRAADVLAYIAVRAVECFLLSLPPAAATAFGEWIGVLWWGLDGRRRARASENLRAAFGTPTDVAARRRDVRRVFVQMTRAAVDAVLAPRLLVGRSLDRRVAGLGPARAEAARVRAGGGGVVATGHLGSWEVGAVVLGRLLPRLRVVARPIDNPLVNAYVADRRGGTVRVLNKRGALAQALKALDGGEWVGLLTDQDAGPGGTFVPFFGIPASTSAAAVMLARRARVPLFAAALLRARSRGGPTFTIRFRPLALPGDLDDPDAADVVLRDLVAVTEGWVREAPDQYNWLHRRWKSRPEGEAPDPRLPAYVRRPGGRGRGPESRGAGKT